MRYRVRVDVRTSLHIRTGPSISYASKGFWYPGQTFVVDDERKYSSGELWYKEEGFNSWSCAYSSRYNDRYLTVIENLDAPKPAPAPQPAPPAGPVADLNYLNSVLAGNKNTGKLAPYDVNHEYQLGVPDGANASSNRKSVAPSLSGTVSFNPEEDLYQDTTFINNALQTTKWNSNANIFTDHEQLDEMMFTNFNRFKINYTEYELGKTNAYIFFTRPDCNFFNENSFELNNTDSNVAGDPFFEYIMAHEPSILRSLTERGAPSQTGHFFNPYLGAAAISFEVADEVIKTENTAENFVGYKVTYGKNNHESMGAGQVNINYRDGNRLIVYNMHKAWVEYISQVYKGMISSKPHYIRGRTLDYACSIFYFLTGPDGESIIYGHKYVGVFPTNVPDSFASWTKGSTNGSPEFAISYEYWFRESLSLLNMAEFNILSKNTTGGKYEWIPVFDPASGASSPTWSGVPFIVAHKDKSTNKTTFKLRFRKPLDVEKIVKI